MSREWTYAVALLTAISCAAGARAADLYKADAGPDEVAVVKLDWKDAKRDRDVPVLIYAPKEGKGPFPVIVFSHGLGGSREGYSYLGKHWASHGYVCVHLQHLGSDAAVWRDSKDPLADLNKAASNLSNAINRPLDVRFALDQLEKLNRDDERFKGRMDMDRVGMAGHSFGAWTTLAVAGERFVTPLGREVSLGDPRVKAAIAMSASVPRNKALYDEAFGAIKVPCLHMTGTLDDSPIGDVKAADKRVPYDHITKADQYLVTFQGGDHMIFSGAAVHGGLTRLVGKQRGMGGDRSKDEHFQELIRSTTTAFWDAYLKGDAKAKAWLTEGACRKALGRDATFEHKAGDGK